MDLVILLFQQLVLLLYLCLKLFRTLRHTSKLKDRLLLVLVLLVNVLLFYGQLRELFLQFLCLKYFLFELFLLFLKLAQLSLEVLELFLFLLQLCLNDNVYLLLVLKVLLHDCRLGYFHVQFVNRVLLCGNFILLLLDLIFPVLALVFQIQYLLLQVQDSLVQLGLLNSDIFHFVRRFLLLRFFLTQLLLQFADVLLKRAHRRLRVCVRLRQLVELVLDVCIRTVFVYKLLVQLQHLLL